MTAAKEPHPTRQRRQYGIITGWKIGNFEREIDDRIIWIVMNELIRQTVIKARMDRGVVMIEMEFIMKIEENSFKLFKFP